ncbi:hypothetical protein [Pedobacter caeni]|uniref:GLPGLI family protein n=1 Tax=Pedobacter caeni TaxID=288992 RepID=A0A1M4VH51_9SPHI|nr:hypothetical protein [Pedobacter caeni]SHE68222.1 hypothetical protein SAMN04488522_101905 [Pedobacter caeni]
MNKKHQSAVVKILFIFLLISGVFNANAQTLNLKNTKWKSKTFWGYGHGIGSEIFPENTKDPYHDFEFLIEFDSLNFISTNKALEQSDVKQIKGSYHIFANGYIKLEIDTLICINKNKPCSLSYKSDYTQYHKYSTYSQNNDGKIEFSNIYNQNSWIDKIVNAYLKTPQNAKVRKAITDNYYIEWLPADPEKIEGNSYTLVPIVYELSKNEEDFDIKRYTDKYKLLNTLYIQRPSKKVFEMNPSTKKLEELNIKGQ